MTFAVALVLVLTQFLQYSYVSPYVDFSRVLRSDLPLPGYSRARNAGCQTESNSLTARGA